MRRIIVIDVNETLLDLGAIDPDFRLVFGDPLALREWFGLLLHYSAVSSLAGPYFDFARLAAAALDMTASSRTVALPEPHIAGKDFRIIAEKIVSRESLPE